MFQRPPEIEELRAQLRGEKYRPAKRKKQQRKPLDQHDIHRLFTLERGNRWMETAARQPAAKMLFGELWHQNELCMMFADSNIGKSALAVQIAESIARRRPIAHFACQAKPQPVVYIDFELAQTQFRQRFTNKGDDYVFSDNFYRAEFKFIADPPDDVDENELLIAAIAYKIQLAKASVVIIDNITCLRGGTENAAVALSLMKSLKMLKTEHNLSIMVLAHTPKRRNPRQPISADDLHGSKLLINFADSAFALGKSNADADLCYLKQIKQRNTRQRYGEENVALCRLQKPGNYLHFKFEGYSHENLHLLTKFNTNRQQFSNEIKHLIKEGFSQRDIARILNLSRNTVARLVDKYADAGGCADDGGCANVPMCECEDDGGYADVPMDGCADDGCEDDADGKEASQYPAPKPGEEVPTNGSNKPPASTDAEDTSFNYLPWEAREHYRRQALTGEPLPVEKPPANWNPKTRTLTIPWRPDMMAN